MAVSELMLQQQQGGVGAKWWSILVLGAGSFAAGIIPLYWTKHHGRPFVITTLLCFGAGVLLATAVVHMLPEVRQLLPRYAEVVFCAGYFLIYTVEELVHLRPTAAATAVGAVADGDSKDSGRISCCSSISLISRSGSNQGTNPAGNAHQTEIGNSSAALEPIPATTTTGAIASTGTVSLLLALCVHSLLEGLAIGVQNSAPKVLLLLGAVSAHKFVVAFCLGVEICSHHHGGGGTGTTGRNANLVQILIFSSGSVIGIAIGMALDGLDETFNQVVIPVLQGIAGGTLLYVTVSEVLPRERNKPLNGVPGGGLWQLIAVISGFVVMTVLSMAISEE